MTDIVQRLRVSQANDLIAYTIESVEQWVEHHVTNRPGLTEMSADEDKQ